MGVDDICNTGLVLGLGVCAAKIEHFDPKRKKRPSSDSEPALTLGLSGETCNKQGDHDVKNQSSCCEEEGEVEIRVSCVSGEDEDGGVHARKKLRLTKQQSALLEDSFNQHTTLNPKQKQALARQLRLRPRQVEVWFQNRRARTKLKQTEMESELLKKWCERLRDENRRLHKEVQELKTTKPLYMNMNLCPSCNTTLGIGDKMAPKTHLFNH